MRVVAVVLVSLALMLTPASADPAGFVCPDHSVVTTADQCPTSGNKFNPSHTGGPGNFPGGGGGGSGGLLGLIHKLTGGLL